MSDSQRREETLCALDILVEKRARSQSVRASQGEDRGAAGTADSLSTGHSQNASTLWALAMMPFQHPEATFSDHASVTLIPESVGKKASVATC